jgi:glucose dehydrogenase
MSNLDELISPQRSDMIVIFASIALTLIGAGLGFWAARTRGLIAALGGPLVFGLWQFHKWITRYDPQTGYFGLDKVWVLGLEIVVFIALGVVSGLVWSRVIAPKIQEKE